MRNLSMAALACVAIGGLSALGCSADSGENDAARVHLQQESESPESWSCSAVEENYYTGNKTRYQVEVRKDEEDPSYLHFFFTNHPSRRHNDAFVQIYHPDYHRLHPIDEGEDCGSFCGQVLTFKTADNIPSNEWTRAKLEDAEVTRIGRYSGTSRISFADTLAELGPGVEGKLTALFDILWSIDSRCRTTMTW